MIESLMALFAFDCLLYLSIGLIVWQFVGYPALVVSLARLRGPRRPASATPPALRASLIVAAYNEAGLIAEKVANLRQISYPGLEIIIVTDGSDDGTDRIAAEAGGEAVTLLHRPERQGKAAAINRAAEIATGDILVFSDANTDLDPDVLVKLLAPFQDPSVGLVSGRKAVFPRHADLSDRGFAQSEGLYWRYEDKIRQAEDRLGNTVATVGELLAIRRDSFRPIPRWVVNDDAYLTLCVLQAGQNVRYARKAVSREYASLETADEHARRRRMTAGRWIFVIRPETWPLRRPLVMAALVSHKWLRLFMPFLFALALAANLAALALAPGRTLLWIVLAGQAAFHLAALLGRGGEHKRGPLRSLLRLCYFVEAANVNAFLGFMDVVGGRASALWPKARR